MNFQGAAQWPFGKMILALFHKCAPYSIQGIRILRGGGDHSPYKDCQRRFHRVRIHEKRSE